MKQILTTLILIFLFSCKNETDTTFDNNQPKEDTIISGEAKIYKEQNGDMVAFLKEEADPIVDETMYETMKINLQVTKTLSDDELKALEEYILSHSK
jgi:cytochrome c